MKNGILIGLLFDEENMQDLGVGTLSFVRQNYPLVMVHKLFLKGCVFNIYLLNSHKFKGENFDE